ncbi:natural cytotoxicity triggering receptor 1 isoform X3 [Pongo abelii]|uniref:natural cytotoxicity triggering receptor 1 isoform X3 n=1 Tax=Pongo abelii TaxID=9601 RepID=UPI0030069052
MSSTLPALLCVGLCLSQRISTQQQTLPKPFIWAEPHFMVPKEKQATICCQGNYGAVEYQLHFEGGLFAVERPKPPERINKVKFYIPDMNSRTAGQYSCIYRVGELWSEPSNVLDVVVTEMYDTPTLSVHPGPEVISGEKVTFYCRLDTATSMFLLLKEGRSSRVQRRYGKVQAEFPLGPVTTAHRGTYRCFGSYNNHAWSFPSEPVKLLVTGDIENTSLAPEDPTFPGLSICGPFHFTCWMKLLGPAGWGRTLQSCRTSWGRPKRRSAGVEEVKTILFSSLPLLSADRWDTYLLTTETGLQKGK